MADDHASSRADAFDLATDAGREAYIRDLQARSPISDRLRYPETPEAYAKMVEESEAEFQRGDVFTLEQVKAHIEELKAQANPPSPAKE